MAEVDPDKRAYQDPECGDEQRQPNALFRAELVVNERGRIHPDERDEGAEVEKLSALLVSEQEGAEQRDESNNENIVARNVFFELDSAKDARRQGAISAHTEEQARGTELCRNRGAEVCDQQSRIEKLKEKSSTYARSHMHERGVHH